MDRTVWRVELTSFPKLCDFGPVVEEIKVDRINTYSGALALLYDFQTLTAAIVAFTAAFLAFWIQRRAVVSEARRRAMAARVRGANLLADLRIFREKMNEMKEDIESELSPTGQAVLPFNEPKYRLPKFIDADEFVEGYADVINDGVVDAIITYRTFTDELRGLGVETSSGVLFDTARRARGLANTPDVVDDETVLAVLDAAIAANDDLQAAIIATKPGKFSVPWPNFIQALTSRRSTPRIGQF